jgi:hypothetical protein
MNISTKTITNFYLNDEQLSIKYIPLFQFILDNNLLYRPFENNYCRLPKLLKKLHNLNENIYRLFKEFYGLIDDSIKDEEYSVHFIIDIMIQFYDGESKDDTCFIYTGFNYSLESKGYYIKGSIKSTSVTNNPIIDFEKFIQYCESDSVYNQYSVYDIRKSITSWKESLINKFHC